MILIPSTHYGAFQLIAFKPETLTPTTSLRKIFRLLQVNVAGMHCLTFSAQIKFNAINSQQENIPLTPSGPPEGFHGKLYALSEFNALITVMGITAL